MTDERHDTAGFLGWFFLGAAVGAATALLMAPGPGRTTRTLLAERGSEAARRAQELANEAQLHAGPWMEKSRALFEEQTQRLLAAFEAGKEAMREEIRKWSPPSPPRE
jgi:gas vesicle protein